ncbi:hypothetical protein [Paenibacillus sp. WLX2291]|uniref:hypothetical protein n=1 Tax=Paenibacillus sp. WLX2291 TaxID=3296934 RepID=UPI0039843D8F
MNDQIAISQTEPYNIDPSEVQVTENEALFEIPEDLNDIQMVMPGPAEFDVKGLSVYGIGGTQKLFSEYVIKNTKAHGEIKLTKNSDGSIHVKTTAYALLKLNLPVLQNKLVNNY